MPFPKRGSSLPNNRVHPRRADHPLEFPKPSFARVVRDLHFLLERIKIELDDPLVAMKCLGQEGTLLAAIELFDVKDGCFLIFAHILSLSKFSFIWSVYL